MVLAEKQYYLEEEIRKQPEQRRQPQVKKKQAAASNRTGSKIVSVLMVAICFGVACLVIARYAKIHENHNQILILEDQLEKEYTRRENLEVDLAFTENLENIEAAAQKSLGMSYPKEDQIVYVDLPDTETEKNEHQIVDKREEGFWSKLLSLLD